MILNEAIELLRGKGFTVDKVDELAASLSGEPLVV